MIIWKKDRKIRENTDHTIYRNSYGEVVPSVTSILKVINKEALVYWANSLGWKHKSVKKELDRTSMVGTIVHEYIEAYITGNTDRCDEIYQIDMLRLTNNDFIEVDNCIKSFLSFWSEHGSEFEILECEKSLVCKSYGGTCDIIANHNGELCIIDLKTSKAFHFTMMLQLSAYHKLYKKIFKKEPKKVGILRMNKTTGKPAKLLWNTDLECSSIDIYYEIFSNALQLYENIYHISDIWESITT